MADLYASERGEVKPRIEQLVEALDLETFRDVRAFNLPLGQKQRLAMACASAARAARAVPRRTDIGVDPRTRREFWKHINAMTQNGVAVLVTTHFMEEAEYVATKSRWCFRAASLRGHARRARRQAPERHRRCGHDARRGIHRVY